MIIESRLTFSGFYYWFKILSKVTYCLRTDGPLPPPPASLAATGLRFHFFGLEFFICGAAYFLLHHSARRPVWLVSFCHHWVQVVPADGFSGSESLFHSGLQNSDFFSIFSSPLIFYLMTTFYKEEFLSFCRFSE